MINICNINMSMVMYPMLNHNSMDEIENKSIKSINIKKNPKRNYKPNPYKNAYHFKMYDKP